MFLMTDSAIFILFPLFVLILFLRIGLTELVSPAQSIMADPGSFLLWPLAYSTLVLAGKALFVHSAPLPNKNCRHEVTPDMVSWPR